MSDIIKALLKAEKVQFSRAEAYIILKNGEYTGKIKVAHPKDGAGTLRVFLWDFENDLQMGLAGGYGYDKLSVAFAGLKFKDTVLTDHPENWVRQLESLGFTIIQAL